MGRLYPASWQPVDGHGDVTAVRHDVAVESDRKKCPACGLTKPSGDFNWRNAARARLQSYCRSFSNGVWRAWYEEPENKKRHLAGLMRRRLRRTERNLRLVTDLKSNPCADCGKVFPTYVMDFDHVGIKTSEVVSSGPFA